MSEKTAKEKRRESAGIQKVAEITITLYQNSRIQVDGFPLNIILCHDMLRGAGQAIDKQFVKLGLNPNVEKPTLLVPDKRIVVPGGRFDH